MSFFFNQVLASNLASFNLRGLNLLISNSLVSSNLVGSYCSDWFNFVGLNSVSFTSVGFTSVSFTSVGFTSVGFTSVGFTSVSFTSVGFTSVSFTSVGFTSVSFTSVGFTSVSFTSVGFTSVSFTSVSFTSVGSDFDNKLRFANAALFSNSPSSYLAPRFFLQGPGSLANVSCFNYPYPPELLLPSYFKHHYFSCQVYFADNLPNFRRNLPLSNLAMSAFSNSYLHHYISFVPSLQLHCSLESNYLILNNLQSSCLQLDSFGSTCLPSISLPDQVTIPSNLSSLSSQDDTSKGGIFFQFSLPKLRLSSFPFALYISRPSSLVPSSPNSNPLEPFDFNRSFYSQNLPSHLGFLGSFIHSSIGDSTSPVGNSIDISTSSISRFATNSDPLSTCELSSLHHFLNLRSRTASFFGFLDSFFLFDSPFLDSLPWDSFSLQQNPFCFPSLPSHLHTSSADFSLFDKDLFLANSSFFPFGKRQSCLYEEHFSLQQDLFRPFNHNCSSYKQHFPLNQEHFLLGEEHFLPSNCIFTSDTPFPSTSLHQLQLCSTFLASFFHASTFKASFKSNYITKGKPLVLLVD